MLGRLPLRVRVLVAMLLPALLLLGALFLSFERVQTAASGTSSRQEAKDTANLVARVAGHSPVGFDFHAFDAVLGDSQLIVDYHGTRLFTGAPDGEPRRFSVEAPFPGGRVVVIGDVENETGLALELTGIAGGVLAILMIVGLVGASTLMRAIRRPVEQAVVVADRLASGDLNARMATDESGTFGRLTAAFNTMAGRLQRADRDQERFLADLAHEIATPINGVIGIAGTAIDGVLPSPADRAEAVKLLERDTARIRALLDDLRKMRMLELPETVTWENVALETLVVDVKERFAADARSGGLTLSVSATPCSVISDRTFVERVVANLVTNAIRYTGRGGEILLLLQRRADSAVIAVRDTGIGVSADDAERIFDRFYRVDAARDRASGGTGLGLPIARRAALAIGATIELDSTPGEGSEFRLVVPLAPKGRTPQRRATDSPRLAPSNGA